MTSVAAGPVSLTTAIPARRPPRSPGAGHGAARGPRCGGRAVPVPPPDCGHDRFTQASAATVKIGVLAAAVLRGGLWQAPPRASQLATPRWPAGGVPGGAGKRPGRQAGSRPCRRTRSRRCTAGSTPAQGGWRQCGRRLGPGGQPTGTGGGVDTLRTSGLGCGCTRSCGPGRLWAGPAKTVRTGVRCGRHPKVPMPVESFAAAQGARQRAGTGCRCCGQPRGSDLPALGGGSSAPCRWPGCWAPRTAPGRPSHCWSGCWRGGQARPARHDRAGSVTGSRAVQALAPATAGEDKAAVDALAQTLTLALPAGRDATDPRQHGRASVQRGGTVVLQGGAPKIPPAGAPSGDVRRRRRLLPSSGTAHERGGLRPCYRARTWRLAEEMTVKRIRTQKLRARRERPGREALPPGPRDPGVVRGASAMLGGSPGDQGAGLAAGLGAAGAPAVAPPAELRPGRVTGRGTR